MKSLSFFDFARDTTVDFARDTVYHETVLGIYKAVIIQYLIMFLNKPIPKNISNLEYFQSNYIGISPKRRRIRQNRHFKYQSDLLQRNNGRETHWKYLQQNFYKHIPEIKWFLTCHLLCSPNLPPDWTYCQILNSPAIQKQLYELAAEVFFTCFNDTNGRVVVSDHPNKQFNHRFGHVHGFTSSSNKMIVLLDPMKSGGKSVIEVPLNTVDDVSTQVRYPPPLLELRMFISDSDRNSIMIPVKFERGLFKVVTQLYPSPQENHIHAFAHFEAIFEAQETHRQKEESRALTKEKEFQDNISHLRERHLQAVEAHKKRIFRLSRLERQAPVHHKHSEHLFTLPFQTIDGSLNSCSSSFFELGDNVVPVRPTKRTETEINQEFGIDQMVVNSDSVQSLIGDRADNIVVDLCLKW